MGFHLKAWKEKYPNHVTINQFSSLTNLSQSTIRNWIKRGVIKTESVAPLIPTDEIERIKEHIKSNQPKRGRPKKC